MRQKIMKIAIIVLIILTLISIGLTIAIIIKENEEVNSSDLESKIETYAKSYYEEYLFGVLEMGKNEDIELGDHLANYEAKGITFTLNNVLQYNKNTLKVDIVELEEVYEKCAINEGKVIFKPLTPYINKEVSVEVIVSCNP